MSSIRLTLFSKPGRNALSGIDSRARFNLEMGVISALPVITIEESRLGGFWHIVLEVTDQDRAFWLGFTSGMDYCRNNRTITVGDDEPN